MMKKITMTLVMLIVTMLTVQAQTYPPKDTPQLEFALQLRVHIDQAFSVGETPHGKRLVIPITGGRKLSIASVLMMV